MKIFNKDGTIAIPEAGALEPGMFGDGSDGSVIFNGSSTVLGITPSGNAYDLNRSIFCVDMTVSAGVTIRTRGFKIFCTGTLTILAAGKITFDGANGTAGPGATGGSGGTAVAGVELGGTSAGGGGGNGTTATGAQAAAVTGVFGMGGSGGAGGAGGVGSAGAGGASRAGGTAINRPLKALTHHLLTGPVLIAGGAGGAGGRFLGNSQNLRRLVVAWPTCGLE